jgi:Protein of unknown function (DUF3455)
MTTLSSAFNGFNVCRAARAGALLACSLGLALAATGAHAAAHSAAPAAASPAPPAALPAPEGERAAFTWAAVGTQNYECKANAQGAFAWAFVAPEAQLLGADKTVVGSHGAGPFWLALDASKVNGSVKARADAPLTGAIPWLLLATQSTGGAGKLANISHIQRINTVGGNAPASGCASAADTGKTTKQGYTADYVFFTKS